MDLDTLGGYYRSRVNLSLILRDCLVVVVERGPAGEEEATEREG